MKKFRSAIVLFSFFFLAMLGCSDQYQSPVAPAEQSSLDKVTITNYTCINYPIGFTGEGEVRYIPGGKWQLKKYGVIEQHSSSDPLANGIMVHYLSLTVDEVTGEGPCQGHWTMTPADNAAEGGIWEGTYQGYRSKSSVPGEWTLPLNIEGHGQGGIIDGMQIFSTAVLTVRADGPTTLPTEWFGVGEGFYKSH
jgi:hypothetical protein